MAPPSKGISGARLRSRGVSAIIVERFADGCEHSIEQVAAACGHLIDPTIAVREYQRHHPNPRIALSWSEVVEKGRLLRLAQTLRQLGAQPRGGTSNRTRWQTFCLPVGSAVRETPVDGPKPHVRVTEQIVIRARRRHYVDGVPIPQIAAEEGTSVVTLRVAIKGRSWKHLRQYLPGESNDGSPYEACGQEAASQEEPPDDRREAPLGGTLAAPDSVDLGSAPQSPGCPTLENPE